MTTLPALREIVLPEHLLLPTTDQTFGQMLRDARQKHRLSQREVADMASLRGVEVSQSYISLIERNAGTPKEPKVDWDKVLAIASVLDLDRDRSLLAAGHNPNSPRERLGREESGDYGIRIHVEFDVIGPDGSRQPLRPDDLSPGLRRKLAAMLLSGELDDSSQ